MALMEGTWINLAFALLSLVMAAKCFLSGQVVAENPPTTTEPESTSPSPAIPSPSLLDPISAEQQRENLEAKLETAYREKWIKEWEEEELKRVFREKTFLWEAQRYNQGRMNFEEEQMNLLALTQQRKALEKSLSNLLLPSRSTFF